MSGHSSAYDHGGHQGDEVVTVKIDRFAGGQRLMTMAGVVGLVGLAATIVGFKLDAKVAHFSYLFAFTYWAGIAFTALILLMIFHAFRAKWMTVLRRPLEGMALSVLILAPLFIPVVFGMPHTFSWVNPDPAHFGDHGMHLLHNKHAYLNTTSFIVRAVGYFFVAFLISQTLWKWSNRQDIVGGDALLQKQRNVATGAIPLMALVLTFASFDWLMSLDPVWFSTIFGVYYFGGSMGVVMALLILAVVLAKGKDLFGDYVHVEHLHNLGKLLFAFTAFWGYIAVSQLLLIWMAGLPEETPFYIIRMRPGWAWVGLVLVFGHFFIPFFALLSRARKRSPRRLAPWAVWALLMHAFDIYYLVFPSLNENQAVFHWTMVTAWLGVGGLAVAFVVWRLQGSFLVPIKDPYLATSLRYRQP